MHSSGSAGGTKDSTPSNSNGVSTDSTDPTDSQPALPIVFVRSHGSFRSAYNELTNLHWLARYSWGSRRETAIYTLYIGFNCQTIHVERCIYTTSKRCIYCVWRFTLHEHISAAMRIPGCHAHPRRELQACTIVGTQCPLVGATIISQGGFARFLAAVLLLSVVVFRGPIVFFTASCSNGPTAFVCSFRRETRLETPTSNPNRAPHTNNLA